MVARFSDRRLAVAVVEAVKKKEKAEERRDVEGRLVWQCRGRI